MAKTFAQKLFIKASYKVCLLNAPEGFDLGEVAEGVTVTNRPNEENYFDMVLLFVNNRVELEESFPYARNAVKYDALLWIAYPKQSSKVKADINRDSLNSAVQEWDYDGVTQIAIDDTWSALRFRPKERVGK